MRWSRSRSRAAAAARSSAAGLGPEELAAGEASGALLRGHQHQPQQPAPGPRRGAGRGAGHPHRLQARAQSRAARRHGNRRAARPGGVAAAAVTAGRRPRDRACGGCTVIADPSRPPVQAGSIAIRGRALQFEPLDGRYPLVALPPAVVASCAEAAALLESSSEQADEGAVRRVPGDARQVERPAPAVRGRLQVPPRQAAARRRGPWSGRPGRVGPLPAGRRGARRS